MPRISCATSVVSSSSTDPIFNGSTSTSGTISSVPVKDSLSVVTIPDFGCFLVFDRSNFQWFHLNLRYNQFGACEGFIIGRDDSRYEGNSHNHKDEACRHHVQKTCFS